MPKQFHVDVQSLLHTSQPAIPPIHRAGRKNDRDFVAGCKLQVDPRSTAVPAKRECEAEQIGLARCSCTIAISREAEVPFTKAMARITGIYERKAVGDEVVAAYLPRPLPPAEPPLEIDARGRELLRSAEYALSRLKLAGEMVASVEWCR
jgi:hypothetical protein